MKYYYSVLEKSFEDCYVYNDPEVYTAEFYDLLLMGIAADFWYEHTCNEFDWKRAYPFYVWDESGKYLGVWSVELEMTPSFYTWKHETVGDENDD